MKRRLRRGPRIPRKQRSISSAVTPITSTCLRGTGISLLSPNLNLLSYYSPCSDYYYHYYYINLSAQISEEATHADNQSPILTNLGVSAVCDCVVVIVLEEVQS